MQRDDELCICDAGSEPADAQQREEAERRDHRKNGKELRFGFQLGRITSRLNLAVIRKAELFVWKWWYSPRAIAKT